MVTTQIVTLKDSMKGENRMVRNGPKAFLDPGMAKEYGKRHNEPWPEMKKMVHQYDGRNYSIFLDRKTNVLHGYLEVEDEEFWAKPTDMPINRRWWSYMADIMETRADNSPVCVDFIPVFHLD